MGMSAWEPTDTWDSSKEEAFREKFNKNVNNVADAAIKDNKTIDCADVALTALVDTAKEMGLRLTFDVWDSSKKKYVSHSSSDSKFKNKKEFLFFVKQNMGAIGVYSRYNFDANGNATVEYVLANRGTTFDNVYDLEQNFDQFIGQSSDFWSSVVYASDFVRMHHNQEVTMVGHSNGGAEAIGNALATNTSAIIFNPAKLNSSYYDGKINNYNKTINAFIVDGDILNAIFGDPQSGINKTKLPAQYEKAYRYSHSRGYELSIINECFHILWKQLLKLWSRINMKNRTWFLIFIICFIFILFALNTEEFVFIVSWTIIAIFGNIINFFKNIF